MTTECKFPDENMAEPDSVVVEKPLRSAQEDHLDYLNSLPEVKKRKPKPTLLEEHLSFLNSLPAIPERKSIIQSAASEPLNSSVDPVEEFAVSATDALEPVADITAKPSRKQTSISRKQKKKNKVKQLREERNRIEREKIEAEKVELQKRQLEKEERERQAALEREQAAQEAFLNSKTKREAVSQKKSLFSKLLSA